MSRVLAWFSCGAASAVATKLAIAEHGDAVTVASIDPGAEHDDNERFLSECEEWMGTTFIRLRSEKYEHPIDVFRRTGYLVGPAGARCTTELKKVVRYAYERPDDRHVWGFTADRREVGRAERFAEQNPGIDSLFPLIEHGLTKDDCYALVARAGIELPAMYRMGYVNNNCIGCVKGGIGYWNKIRVDFPDVFRETAELEREMGRTVLREKPGKGQSSRPLWLDELDPGRGNYGGEPNIECGPSCEIVEQVVTLRGPA